MDRGYVLEQLSKMGYEGQAQTVVREDSAPEPRKGGLGSDIIAPQCYGVMVRAMKGSTLQTSPWAELPEEEKSAIFITVEQALLNYERLDGKTWGELAEMFFATFAQNSDGTVPKWDVLPKDFKSGWEAFARHFAYLADCEDIPRDLDEQEAEWDGWVLKRQTLKGGLT